MTKLFYPFHLYDGHMASSFLKYWRKLRLKEVMTNKTFDSKAAAIIQNKLQEVQSKLTHQDYLNHYIYETLESFAFRYFDSPLAPEQVAKDIMRVAALEKGIKEAIKIKNVQLRAGIGELVKRVSKEQGPTIMREIRVTLVAVRSRLE
jgi:hypothetical protein